MRATRVQGDGPCISACQSRRIGLLLPPQRCQGAIPAERFYFSAAAILSDGAVSFERAGHTPDAIATCSSSASLLTDVEHICRRQWKDL